MSADSTRTAISERLWWWRYRASKWRHEWRDELTRRAAHLLPERLCYWVLIRMGASHITGAEVVPDVPFMTVLERVGNGSLSGAKR